MVEKIEDFLKEPDAASPEETPTASVLGPSTAFTAGELAEGKENLAVLLGVNPSDIVISTGNGPKKIKDSEGTRIPYAAFSPNKRSMVVDDDILPGRQVLIATLKYGATFAPEALDGLIRQTRLANFQILAGISKDRKKVTIAAADRSLDGEGILKTLASVFSRADHRAKAVKNKGAGVPTP